MAQLRLHYDQFATRDVEVVVVGPEKAAAFADYWRKESLPFIGLPDPQHRILKLYGQEVNLFKLGRMPAQVLIDKTGTVRFVHYGNSMRDIPTTKEVLHLVDSLARGAPDSRDFRGTRDRSRAGNSRPRRGPAAENPAT